jgi:hypothetical protein
MELVYPIDAASSAHGHVLAVPVPQASSIQLSATLPGIGLDVTVIPAAGVRISQSGSETSVQATVPSTSGVQIAWRFGQRPVLNAPSIAGSFQSSVLWRAGSGRLFEDKTATVHSY